LVDLRRNCYFSYGYSLTCSLQRSALGGEQPGECWSSLFCWNAHLARPFAAALGGAASPALRRWVLPLIHGSFGSLPLALCGSPCSLVLLARRSRCFAGTRYRKRGVSEAGDVANDVETEQARPIVAFRLGPSLLHPAPLSQIVDAGSWPCRRDGAQPPPPRCASVLQVRGSIPLFWSQQASPLSPKPDIVLSRFDPFYDATRLHFAALASRYGGRTVVLSLIKAVEKRPREALLRRELCAAVEALNAGGAELALCGWDLSRRAKAGRPEDVLRDLSRLTTGALALTRLFVSPRPLHLGSAPRSAADCDAARHAASALGWASSGRGGPPPSLRRVAQEAWTSAGAETISGLEEDCAAAELLDGEDVFAGGLLQAGVLRSNCIDCLDRTNVAQFALGCAALGVSLLALGLADSAVLPPDAPCLEALSSLYQAMGDALAQQYGGSDAHNPVLAAAAAQAQAPRASGGGGGASASSSSSWTLAGGYSRELLTSVRRFYSATVTDAEKQDAMNVFLGQFVPRRGRPQVWELESDVWMHTRVGGAAAGAAAGGEPAVEPRAAAAAQPSWEAWDGRRSPFGRAAAASAAASGGLDSFDAASETWPADAVRMFPPAAAGGYTSAAPGLAAAAAAREQAAAETETAAAAARQRARLRAQRHAQRAAAVREQAGAFVNAVVLQPELRCVDEAQARARYSQAATQQRAWAALFDGSRAVQREAARAEAEAALTPGEALQRERDAAVEPRGRCGDAAAAPAATLLRRQSSSAVAPSPHAARDATLAAARSFLLADATAGAPEWLARVAASAMAAATISPRPAQAPAAAASEAQPGRPPVQPPADAKPAPFPPSPGMELRLWLLDRGATARREADESLRPLRSLGNLGPGVLRDTCPPAANTHAMCRHQLQRLTEAPAWPALSTAKAAGINRLETNNARQVGRRVAGTPGGAAARTSGTAGPGWAAAFSPSAALRAVTASPVYSTPARLAQPPQLSRRASLEQAESGGAWRGLLGLER